MQPFFPLCVLWLGHMFKLRWPLAVVSGSWSICRLLSSIRWQIILNLLRSNKEKKHRCLNVRVVFQLKVLNCWLIAGSVTVSVSLYQFCGLAASCLQFKLLRRVEDSLIFSRWGWNDVLGKSLWRPFRRRLSFEHEYWQIHQSASWRHS